MYGYFSSDATKFSWTIYEIQTLPLEGVEVFFIQIEENTYCVVAKLGTGIPCYCDSDINVTLHFDNDGSDYTFDTVIPYGTSGLTIQNIGLPFSYGTSIDVPNGATLKYLPVSIGDYVNFVDGDYVDFSLVIDPNIKQIDILSSIAKKFNLVLIPDPNNGYNIRIEPYDYYIGTGQIHNWSDKISYDKGFTVEPALNYIESQIKFTDQEDNDEGNKLFKESNNRIYGQNIYYGPTAFKSQEKIIDTIFGPELIRKWDADNTNNISLPLGINYVGSNQQGYTQGDAYVNWIYKGVKTKPKLFWWLGSFNPFLDSALEVYNASNYWTTYEAYVSNTSGSTFTKFDRVPVISHTMPMGNPDSNKINNDTQCILFNSEYPSDEIGVQTFNTYTENDAFSTFYQGRVSNLYNPNTRVLTGYFNLNYSDIKNLEPQDLIKINEQFFVVSKIEAFNLTNRELTKVELVQFNNRPKQYVDRYFEYYYCDNPSVKYKFKTDFTNPNLLDSNFGWSIYYDHQIGNLSSTASGFTSTFRYVQNFSTTVYTPYYIYEISADDYVSSSATSWDCDTLHNYIYNTEQYGPFQYSMPTFWLNSTSTQTGTNLFADCASFATAASTYGILTGSSTYFGTTLCPSPTPTPTHTPTPTPTPTPIPTVNIEVDYYWRDASNLMNQTVNISYEPFGLLGTVTFNTVSGHTHFGPIGMQFNPDLISNQKSYCLSTTGTTSQVQNVSNLYVNNVFQGSPTSNTNGIIPVCPDLNATSSAGFLYTSVVANDNLRWELDDAFVGATHIKYDVNSLSSYPGTGSTLYDISGMPYNATLYNSPTYTSGLTSPDYLTFNGTNQYSVTPFNGQSDATYSVGGWVSIPTPGLDNFIIVRGEYESYVLCTRTGKFAVTVYTDVQHGAIGTTSIVSNQWYYVIGVYNHITRRAKIYVNGQLQRNNEVVGYGIAPSSTGWTLGYNQKFATYSNVNISTMDIYQYEISSSEILNNFNSTKSLYGY
jgi:hypothetical protein